MLDPHPYEFNLDGSTQRHYIIHCAVHPTVRPPVVVPARTRGANGCYYKRTIERLFTSIIGVRHS